MPGVVVIEGFGANFFDPGQVNYLSLGSGKVSYISLVWVWK